MFGSHGLLQEQAYIPAMPACPPQDMARCACLYSPIFCTQPSLLCPSSLLCGCFFFPNNHTCLGMHVHSFPVYWTSVGPNHPPPFLLISPVQFFTLSVSRWGVLPYCMWSRKKKKEGQENLSQPMAFSPSGKAARRGGVAHHSSSTGWMDKRQVNRLFCSVVDTVTGFFCPASPFLLVGFWAVAPLPGSLPPAGKRRRALPSPPPPAEEATTTTHPNAHVVVFPTCSCSCSRQPITYIIPSPQ